MKPERLTPESIARAAAIHRKLAKLYEELGDLFEALAEPVREPAPPTDLDQERAKKMLRRRGYKVA